MAVISLTSSCGSRLDHVPHCGCYHAREAALGHERACHASTAQVSL